MTVVGSLYRWDRASWGAPPVNKAHFTSLSGKIPEHQDGHDFLRSYGSCLEFFGGRQPQNSHLFCQSITRELFSLTSIVVVPTAPQHCPARKSPLLWFVSWPRNTRKILLFLAERKKGHVADADEGIYEEGAFPESWRRRAVPESGGSLRCPRLRGTLGVWDAAGSDAGQQLCVPLLLQGLLHGEGLK